MASRTCGTLVAIVLAGIVTPALAQGTSGAAAGSGGTGSASAAAAAGSTGAYGNGAYGAGGYGAYSGTNTIRPATNLGITGGTVGTTGRTTGTTTGPIFTPRKATNYFVPSDPSLVGPSATASAQRSTAINGSNTAPGADQSMGAVGAAGVGVGHTANGQPIGSSGSGLGSPENPIGSTSR
ncbi:hypothetical protein [Bradyrhizobium sp. CB2312]|uniref:hypothetical protein n=1 Tax=Bradyrhizobium sp. CB2312 TaxID=3039155 RepID=UPI0024B1E0A5|nr:hypothetical protein [Bradyrhizobium sp. CB2312]WFU71678.1 hypothetical protein QA642_42115 [Bradyrhizobium sp. CB2312]